MSDVGVDSNPYDSSDGANELSWMLIWGAFGYALIQLFKPTPKILPQQEQSQGSSGTSTFSQTEEVAVDSVQAITTIIEPITFIPTAIVTVIEPSMPMNLYGGYEGDDYTKFKVINFVSAEISNTSIRNIFSGDLLQASTAYVLTDIGHTTESNVMAINTISMGMGSICTPSSCMSVWPDKAENPSISLKNSIRFIEAIGFAISLRTKVKMFEEGEDWSEF